MKLLQLSAIAAAAALLVACGGSDEPAGPKRGELLDPARVVTERHFFTPEDLTHIRLKPDSLPRIAFGCDTLAHYDPLEVIVR